MRICLIGDCGGHIGSAFDSKAKGLEYVGAAVSGEGETMDNILRFAAGRGYDIPLYDDWKEMLTGLKPDIAVVDTVFSRHSEVSHFALEQGINVYSEKPAATELSELSSLEAAASGTDAKLFSMLTLRFDPWFYTAKKLIDSGAVGEIRMINGQKSYKLGRRAEFFKHRSLYGGTIPWVSIHMLDQILWLSGKKCLTVSGIQSSGYNAGHGDLETACLTTLLLEGDVLASVNTDYCRASAPTHGDDRIRVVGTDGILEVRGDRVYLINSDNNGKEPLENLKPEKIFDGFLNVLGGSQDGIYRDCDGLYAARVALYAREAADTGKVLAVG